MVTGNSISSLKKTKRSASFMRFIELLFALLLLSLLTPLFILIGVFIKLESKGPVFFTQERGGKDGRHFTIYKFRTMFYEPEKRNLDLDTSENDPRITKNGNFLRKTSLDELPQLINIVKGDMAFIGPRPTMTSQTDNYNDYQMQRLQIKPGVTGLAQVSGRNSILWDERIDIDIDYLQRKSFRLDCYILMQTFLKIFRPEGIYRN